MAVRHFICLAAAGAAAPATARQRARPTAMVAATAETEPVGTVNRDAADDPAIWRNPADPAASLIVATDKRGRLHVYGLDGRSLAYDPSGRLNNVDLIDLGSRGILVAASDRNDEANARIALPAGSRRTEACPARHGFRQEGRGLRHLPRPGRGRRRPCLLGAQGRADRAGCGEL